VAIKFLADYLKSHGYIDDDTPRYFTAISSTFDNHLGKDEFVAKVCCWGYKLRDNDGAEAITTVLPSGGDDSSGNNKSVRTTAQRTRKTPARPRASRKNPAKVSNSPKGRAKRSKGGN
jgi:hypothetical protein